MAEWSTVCMEQAATAKQPGTQSGSGESQDVTNPCAGEAPQFAGMQQFQERWQSGRMRRIRNPVHGSPVTRVRIPPSPPDTQKAAHEAAFCVSGGEGGLGSNPEVRQIGRKPIWTDKVRPRSGWRTRMCAINPSHRLAASVHGSTTLTTNGLSAKATRTGDLLRIWRRGSSTTGVVRGEARD